MALAEGVEVLAGVDEAAVSVVVDLEVAEDEEAVASVVVGPAGEALVVSAVAVVAADLAEVALAEAVDSASEVGVVSSGDDPAAGLKVAVAVLEEGNSEAVRKVVLEVAAEVLVVAAKADSARVDEVEKADSAEELKDDSAEAAA